MKRIGIQIGGGMLLMLLLLTLSAPAPATAGDRGGELQTTEFNPPADPTIGTTIYLPLVSSKITSFTPSLSVLIGSESCCSHDPVIADTAQNAYMNLMRVAAFDWKSIEPYRTSPATYDWTKVNNEKLKNLADRGITVIGTVRFSPAWAQKYPPYSCGPIAESALDAFAQFLTEAVKIYSQPPYSIKYWELGNEVDAPAFANDPDSIFGCWGGWDDDPYYGGSYYARILEKTYPAMKAANPAIQVLIGGLLLDCDPTNPPAGKTCTPAKFLEGILINNGKYDGGNYFDAVSFHGYPFYAGSGKIGYDEDHPYWAHRGGVVLGKIDFVRSVLAKYNVAKPILHTEGALLCHENNLFCNPPDNQFLEAQANYVVWLYIRNWAAGVIGTSWYSFEGPGWRNSSLLDGKQQPRPAYYSLKNLTTRLDRAEYRQQIYQYPGLRVYEFTTPYKRIWVMWSPDQQPHTIDLPSGTFQIVDKYGAAITPINNQITVNSPVYIDIQP